MLSQRFFRPAAAGVARSLSVRATGAEFHERIKGDADTPGRFMKALSVPTKGADVTRNPLYNKGSAFSTGERDRLGIRGLVHPKITPMDLQIERVMKNFRNKGSDIDKYLFISELHNRNETLYHRVLIDYIEELAPIVYTPTVGQACQEFSLHFRRPRGMYFTKLDRGHMHAMCHNWPAKEVHVVVVTDGSRILGLGDLGAQGMGIPIGKLALYVAAGGIAPHRVMPVVLDVGTNNESLLDDPLYVGMHHERLEGQEYLDLVDEFMDAVHARFPSAVIQFEDFENSKANTLLERYRNVYPCFNDDIQGTGAVTLAGVLSALRAQGKPPAALQEERIVVVGSGSSGLGVAQQLADGMVEAGGGFDMQKARDRFYVCSSVGLIGSEGGEWDTPNLARGLPADRALWQRDDLADGMPLLDLVKAVKPTILLGLSTTHGIFTEEVVRAMDEACDDPPIVFPLSNPTSKSECTAEEAYGWTNGRALFASGSPFDPVDADGRTLLPSQCNNMYIFPGVGLGASLSGARSITDKMLYESAVALANCVNEEEKAKGQLFPDLTRIRDVSAAVGKAVISTAVAEGLHDPAKVGDAELGDLDAFVARKMYDPVYVPLIPKEVQIFG